MRRQREDDEDKQPERSRKRVRWSDEDREEEEGNVDDHEADREFARRLEQLVTGAPVNIREGEDYIELPARRAPGAGEKVRARREDGDPAVDRDIDDDYLEEIARDYYPAEGGLVRDRQTGQPFPGQEFAQPHNRLDLALEQFMQRQFQLLPDYQMAELLAPLIGRTVAWAIDTGAAMREARVAATAARQQKLRDDLVKQGLATVNEDILEARARLAEITREQQYVQVNIRDAAARWLQESGAETWSSLTGLAQDATTKPVCAGMVMPAYWAWQYRLLKDEVLQRGTTDVSTAAVLAPSARLLADVTLILDTDADLFGSPWVGSLAYATLRPILTKMPVPPAAAAAAAPPAPTPYEWRLAFVIYVMERDVWLRLPGLLTPRTIGDAALSQPLSRIQSQSQWLSAIILYHLNRAIDQLPTLSTTEHDDWPLYASRTGETTATAAGETKWPVDVDEGFRRASVDGTPYPYLWWNTGDSTSPDISASNAAAGGDRVMETRDLFPFLRAFDPDFGDGLRKLPRDSNVPTAGADYTNIVLSGGGGAATQLDFVHFDVYRVDKNGGRVLSDIRTSLERPEHLLSREFADTVVSYTARYPSLGCYERVVDLFDRFAGPHIRTFMQLFAPNADRAIPDIGRLFGLQVPSTEATDFRPYAKLGNAAVGLQPRKPFFTSGTWRDLFDLIFDKAFKPDALNEVDFTKTIKWNVQARAAGGIVRGMLREINPRNDEEYRPLNRYDKKAWDFARRAGTKNDPTEDTIINGESFVMTDAFMAEIILPALMQGEWSRAFMRDMRSGAAVSLFDIGQQGMVHFPLPFLPSSERARASVETTQVLPPPDANAAAAGGGQPTTTVRKQTTIPPKVDPRAIISATLYERAINQGQRFLGRDPDTASSIVVDSGEAYMAEQAAKRAGEDTGPDATAELAARRHRRFLFWQQITRRPWVTLATFVDYLRWAWDDTGGEHGGGAQTPESYGQQIGSQRLLIKNLEERLRRRATLERNAQSLADIAREDFLPTAEYMNLPHIAGYLRFSADFRMLLKAGMAFVRRAHPRGREIKQDWLTNPIKWPDLAYCFAHYIKECQAHLLLTHEERYTTQHHAKQVPYSRQPTEINLLAEIDNFFAGTSAGQAGAPIKSSSEKEAKQHRFMAFFK